MHKYVQALEVDGGQSTARIDCIYSTYIRLRRSRFTCEKRWKSRIEFKFSVK